MRSFSHLIVMFGALVFANAKLDNSRLFDEELYRNVIDTEECRRQIAFLKTDEQSSLLMQFQEAGIAFPRGFSMLNLVDLGNYPQCLSLNEEFSDMKIEGKYYLLNIPFDQTFQLPFDEIFINDLINSIRDFFERFYEVQRNINRVDQDAENLDPENPLANMLQSVDVALCVPKPCTSQEWFTNMYFNFTAFGFKYEEVITRLPNDKPWVAADYVAIVVFSLLGFITLLSTYYDVNHVVIQKKDPKKANILLRSFSVYTNTQRLLTFTPNANALDCLDGLRSISMLWVLAGHTFSMHNINANLLDLVAWLTSGDSVWISTGIFAVDSFFLMGGILLTYTTVGKMSGIQFLKRLHLFYLNRLLRMFPLLAALVLLEASVFHRVADGPHWDIVGENVQNCRTYWWTTLLHVQNFVNPDHICIPHSWYIAIDIQLYIISPIVIYWLLGKNKRMAWIALIGSLLAVVVASTIYNFLFEFPSTTASIVRLSEQKFYLSHFYQLPWTRGAPFFVGMIVGYILNMYKGKKVHLNMGFVLISWVISLGMLATTFYVSYVIMQLDWDNQVADSLINSFIRVLWSIGLSWLIFACSKGYGGPINWFLTLNVWKLPARISFAMYLYHYVITFVIEGMQIAPVYFSMGARIFDLMGVFCISFIVSFFMTVVIDAPFSVLIKIAMEGGPRRRRPPPENGINSKAGPLPEKSIANLERTITTLEKNDPNIEKNIMQLEKNGSNHNENGISDKIEVMGELPPTKDVVRF